MLKKNCNFSANDILINCLQKMWNRSVLNWDTWCVIHWNKYCFIAFNYISNNILTKKIPLNMFSDQFQFNLIKNVHSMWVKWKNLLVEFNKFTDFFFFDTVVHYLIHSEFPFKTSAVVNISQHLFMGLQLCMWNIDPNS